MVRSHLQSFEKNCGFENYCRTEQVNKIYDFFNKALFPPQKRLLVSYLPNMWVENPLNIMLVRRREFASFAPCSTGEECIICGCSGLKLAQCKDTSSWTTLHRAAVIRNHKLILEASTESEFPESTIKYHRNCRAEFTNKRDLQTNKPSDDAATGTALRRSSRDGNQPNAAILPDQCLLCKKSKYKPNTKTRERLHNVQEFRADETVRECASQLHVKQNTQ